MLFNNVSYLVKKHIIHLNHSTYYHNYIYIHNSILSILSRREGHFLRVIITAYYYSENHEYQRVTEVNNKNCVYWRTNANIVW